MLLALAFVAPAVASEYGSEEEIKARIEQARKQLDEAARKLAELHTQMWELETSGPRAERPMLGILLQDSGTDEGLTLGGVTPDGGAEQAGLKAGDTIVEVNGVRLAEDRRLNGGSRKKPLHALREAMAPVKAGEAVPVTYRRGSETLTASVVTQARGAYMARVVEEKAPWLDGLRSLENLEDLEALEGLEELQVLNDLGDAELDDAVLRGPAGLRLHQVDGELARYFAVDRGVIVLQVPDRVAALKAGDVLIDLGGEAPGDAAASLERLASLKGRVPVRVKRQGTIQEVVLDADALNARQSLHVFRDDQQIRIRRGSDGKTALEIVIGEED